jgi:hypothetical protein
MRASSFFASAQLLAYLLHSVVNICKKYSLGWGDNITMKSTEESLKQSVELIKEAKGIVITAGSAVSKECGLPLPSSA